MKTLSLFAVLLFASPAFADAGVADAGVAEVKDSGITLTMPAVLVVGTTISLADGGSAPALLLPDGGVITAMTADDVDSGALAKEILDAGRTKNWKLLIAGLVMLLTWGLRLFGGKFIPFLKTDRGGVMLALSIATVGALFNAWKAGAGVSVQLFIDAISMGVFSIGGFTALKKSFFPADKAAPTPAPAEPPKA